MDRNLFYHDISAATHKLLSVYVKFLSKRASDTVILHKVARISEEYDFSAKSHLLIGIAVARIQGQGK